MEEFTRLHSNYLTPSRTFFYQNRCPFVSAPVLQSCVDIRTSSLTHYMRALAKYIRNNRQVQLSLDMCTCPQHRLANSVQWQNFLNDRHEHLVEYSCCSKVPHRQLAIGIGSGFKIPKLIPWKCVWNNCGNYGIENKLKML